MKNAVLCLAAVLGFAIQAHAGSIDLSVTAGSSFNLGTSGVGSSLALSTAKTTGVAGFADGTYSITGANLNILTATTLSLTGIPGEPTVLGTYTGGGSVSDGSGGLLIQGTLDVTPPAGLTDYSHGTFRLDVTTTGSVKSGDIVFTSPVPEPASLAMMAIGLAASVGGYRLRGLKKSVERGRDVA